MRKLFTLFVSILLITLFLGCGISTNNDDVVSSNIIGDLKDLSEQKSSVSSIGSNHQMPLAPTNVKVKWATDRVQLNWVGLKEDREIAGYNIYRALDGDLFSELPINPKPNKVWQRYDLEVLSGKTYKYKITSVGINGLESEPSSIAFIKVPLKLVAVTNLMAENDGETVVLKWTSSLPVNFFVERNTTALGITDKVSFKDINPPKEKLVYKVYPIEGDTKGPVTEIIIDLTKKYVQNTLPKIEQQYIGNASTKKFHGYSCRYVEKIKPENIVVFNSRAEAIEAGYDPCMKCNP